ncbi:cytochrome P450 [Fusarium albosuccineum]|uniref:Cytochrome P450 n=1 Tax=Fusarium albosuccineum TaxID=1237068 RepID=A0A8H4PJ62_9HYPO|nr:cytochrome P450 [Fusarium albosuccineum]
MSVPSWTGVTSFDEDTARPVAYTVASLLFLVFLYCNRPGTKSNVPLLNKQGDFSSRAHGLVEDWFRKNPEKPMRLAGDVADVTVLPPSLAQEVRNDKRLDFSEWTFRNFHAHLPGFDGIRAGAGGSNLVQIVVTKDLTKLLSKVTEPLTEEMAMVLEERFTNKSDWHTIPLREHVLHIVARISSRVFLGPELCRNEDWLRITREYTVLSFTAADEIKTWPRVMRPFVHWFLPSCRRLREQAREARQIVDPTMDARRKLRQKLLAEGKEAPQYDDSLEWFEQAAKGNPYDATGLQLSISLAAIHTTTDLLCEVMMRLAQNQDILQPLRSEIASVLKEEGWSKSALQKMKLLDSVIKESQRMKPTELVSMQRLVLEDMTLSDGTKIPKNTGLAVSSHRMWNADVHSSPNQWDGYRFYKMRDDPVKHDASLLVSTGPDHLAFGHGKHACPGRFFAANEIKIALIHIVMKYDWELVGDKSPQVYKHGFTLSGDPFLQFQVKRRQEEVKI